RLDRLPSDRGQLGSKRDLGERRGVSRGFTEYRNPRGGIERLAQEERDPGEDDHGEEEVHHDAGGDHQRAGPERLRIEVARGGDVFLVRPALQGGGVLHTGHTDVTAERESGDDVLRLSTGETGDPGTEADREARDFDVDGLRGEQVPQLVHEDQDPDDDEESDERQQSAFDSMKEWVISRAQRSASATDSTSVIGPPGHAPSALAIAEPISRNPIRSRRNAATATSLAALNTAGYASPALPAETPSAKAGKLSRRIGSNVRVPASTGSKRRHLYSARSGKVSAYSTGISIVGNPNCASTEPSTNSTIEWMID